MFIQKYSERSQAMCSAKSYLVAVAIGFWKKNFDDNFILYQFLQWFRTIVQLGFKRRIEFKIKSILDKSSSIKQISDGARSMNNRQNGQQIQSILKYWFLRHSPDRCHMTLWQVDDQHSPFSWKADKFIAERYTKLLVDLANTLLLNEWCDSDTYGYEGKVAAIIVLDQFSRHVRRYHTNLNRQTRIPEQSLLNELALQTSRLFFQQHGDAIVAGMIPIQMCMLVLMPFCRAHSIEDSNFVLEQVQVLGSLVGTYKDSLDNLHQVATMKMDSPLRVETIQSLMDPCDTVDQKADIQGNPLHAESKSTPASNHVVYRTVKSFLGNHGFLPNEDNMHIIVEMAGDVNSMVLAHVISHLTNKYAVPVIATHIVDDDPEKEQSAYMKYFCDSLGISFKYLGLEKTRVTRMGRHRLGEVIAPQAERLNQYRRFATTELGLSSDQLNKVGTFLGYDGEDMREHVLSNALNGSGLLNLCELTSFTGTKNEIKLLHPFLTLEKKDIYDYAHSYNVPYWTDCTITSNRNGKIRKNATRLLQDCFRARAAKNLTNLSIDSQDCRALLQSTLFDEFFHEVVYKPMGIIVHTARWRHLQNIFFWKYVLGKVLQAGGLRNFSYRSLLSFLKRIQTAPLKEGWLSCRKEYSVLLRRDGSVYIFYPRCFSCLPNENGERKSHYMEFGRENSLQIDSWRITAYLLRNARSVLRPHEEQERLQIKAIPSIDVFMEGSLDYYIQVPTWEKREVNKMTTSFEPRPLVFRNFTKLSRPQAWKKMEFKLEQMLPIVGVDDLSFKALRDPFGSGATHVGANGDLTENPVYLVKVSLHLASKHSNG